MVSFARSIDRLDLKFSKVTFHQKFISNKISWLNCSETQLTGCNIVQVITE